VTIHLYTMCWNEAHLLDFFFRHYDPWVDRYVIYDDGSDDGTLEKLRRHPRVEVRRFRRTVEDSFVMSQNAIHNEAWKESRGQADWVVVTAIDEHLELAGGGDQLAYLEACRGNGVTAVPAIGYQMVSWTFPRRHRRLARDIRWGAPFDEMHKLSIFDPERIRSAGFQLGRHKAAPEGDVVYPARERMMLLHFKYMGFVRTIRRERALGRRLGPTDVRNRWGNQYFRSFRSSYDAWRDFWDRAVDVTAPGFDPTAPGHVDGALWWRTPGGGAATA
jgi:hypothetical protein